MSALRRNADWIIAVVALAAGTAFFAITDADLAWTAPYCEGGAWSQGGRGLWAALYHFGTIPALLACAAAVVVFVAGFRSARLARFRRPAVFLILLMALGPGLAANAVLKDNWGRPRPRDVAELGGRERFERVLHFDPASEGKSFPCGHATMGFFFFGGYYLFRRRRKGIASGFLLFGLVSGGLIGWARVAQGGHFPSDVLWAGGLVWLCAALLARVVRPDELPPVDAPFRPAGWGRLAAAGLLIPALVFAALLATPIETREERNLGDTADLSLRIEGSKLTVSPGAETTVTTASTGFGLPGSGIRSAWSFDAAEGGAQRARLAQRRSGIVTELSQRVHLVYNPSRVSRVKIEMPSGSVVLRLPRDGADAGAAGARRWDLAAGSGYVVIEHAGALFDLDSNGAELRDAEPESDRITIRSAGGGVRFDPPLPGLPDLPAVAPGTAP